MHDRVLPPVLIAPIVRVTDGAAELDRDRQRHLDGDPPPRGHHAVQLRQIAAVDVLHHQEGPLADGAVVDDAHHARVRQASGDARFGREQLAEQRLAEQLRMQRLDDDLLAARLAPRQPRAPDLRHAALPEQLDEEVAAEDGPAAWSAFHRPGSVP